MSYETLRRTPLFDAHVALGAKIVPFAGYEMPVQYPAGIIAEHNWTRQSAGLFDVSHMGQCFIEAKSFEEAARSLERLVPADVLGLAPGQQRYTQFLNADGGTLDDLMVTRPGYDGHEGLIYVVVNASRKESDFARLAAAMPEGVTFTTGDDYALLALQGPKAEAVLARLAPAAAGLKFMFHAKAEIAGTAAHVSRSGYTGEDGFEISVHGRDAVKLWNVLLAQEEVKPVGLGARDSLRLEAGLCLYGHELDETISPVEADLVWSIGKRRRAEGGFTGAARVQRELAEGPKRRRVGIRPEGRAPARDGAVITDTAGRPIGVVTSGGFGPSVNGPVAMGYVEAALAAPGTPVRLIVRDRALPAEIVKLPFVPNNFKR